MLKNSISQLQSRSLLAASPKIGPWGGGAAPEATDGCFAGTQKVERHPRSGKSGERHAELAAAAAAAAVCAAAAGGKDEDSLPAPCMLVSSLGVGDCSCRSEH